MTESDRLGGLGPSLYTPPACPEPSFVPFWARSTVQYAQNLLESSDEPIEYYDDEEDYQDNFFFFPEDCVYYPRKDSGSSFDVTESDHEQDSADDMIPELPDIKMLDTAALADLLEDNLSPPEITSILVFATNGAIFAHASPLPARQLRTLSATYGAAYTSYAINDPSGNLTGVNAASHPSSFVTATSVPLRHAGSIVFELENLVAVVTKIADKVLLAVIGPSRISTQERASATNGAATTKPATLRSVASDPEDDTGQGSSSSPALDNPVTDASLIISTSAPNPVPISMAPQKETPSADHRPHVIHSDTDTILEAQWEIDRSSDLDRLASLNLSSPPSILLALETKSAALGRFLSNKLEDLENPDDF